MSDSYQAIYDAVRSRISGGNVGDIVADACRNAFDISHIMQLLHQDFSIAAGEMGRPAVVFKPTLSIDGNMWCALLGENLATGLAGFGSTPAEAMQNFDIAFYKQQTPAALKSRSPQP